ncbi:Fe-S cluster assembly ATPase SufC [Chromohalobacter canadensis]|uniref:Fe-S cluster assembly ATP-binding protein n=1 Tax=Chromohalobacter canadensis TaxID=141389 RepID=A0A285VJJ6_9GAMM|nr:Fe-S cluster assembly ATPase SufC [Chromohalobacter canadensis]MCK0767987.1 Fe-S cluster assembly ATPase SufC [Chromohalobacter canadensis]MCT8467693.1 Fe-S cluster assembly ATPase SufC [Chromohalobacter canadensis]MCT8470559.1 Fe-S cluster assembly ATPase SufC [Chromohalobacter canadensis]MCT8498190.1 Fe-S cluster assembly ATPase SufC [Chromohalobacter canadensis]WQH08555.1 Fe-S cluster assembly ATPase SufC [Chromohalobacter canadensis]
MLEVKDLYVTVEGSEILKGLNLTVNPGEVHALMGPNGAGKSTLSAVIAGKDGYEVTSGEILFEGKNLLEMEIEERALAGILLGFQYPVEIPGVKNIYLLKAALNAQRVAHGEEEIPAPEFMKLVREQLSFMKMDGSFLQRAVNEGFSGGEKKRNEILQMLVLQPKLAMLDEIDSGLDIDAMKVVAEGINSLRNADRAILMVTHYQRLLEHIVPDRVHVLVDGRIVKSGDKDLANELEARGYEWVLEESAA